MEVIYGLIGVMIGAILKDYIKFSFFKRKKDYQNEQEIIHKAIYKSIQSMKDLLGSMSTTKNSIDMFLKNTTDDSLKKSLKEIKKCIKCFEDNRGDLFLFIYKEKSPIFIDYTVVLQAMLDNYKEKDKDKICDTFEKFKSLYDQYYEQLEKFEKKPKI